MPKLLLSTCEAALVFITLDMTEGKSQGQEEGEHTFAAFLFHFDNPQSLYEPLQSCDCQDKSEEARRDLRGYVGSI